LGEVCLVVVFSVEVASNHGHEQLKFRDTVSIVVDVSIDVTNTYGQFVRRVRTFDFSSDNLNPFVSIFFKKLLIKLNCLLTILSFGSSFRIKNVDVLEVFSLIFVSTKVSRCLLYGSTVHWKPVVRPTRTVWNL